MSNRHCLSSKNWLLKLIWEIIWQALLYVAYADLHVTGNIRSVIRPGLNMHPSIARAQHITADCWLAMQQCMRKQQ